VVHAFDNQIDCQYCHTTVISSKHAGIPYLIKPEEIVPGKANYYASTFFDGTEYCSVVVKVRDGRPIKIEGNVQSPVSRGGTSARVQASVLNLYYAAIVNTFIVLLMNQKGYFPFSK